MVARTKRAGTLMPTLGMLLPSKDAKIESLDDGSLLVRDALTREGHATYWSRVAELVEAGIANPPARVVLVVAGEPQATAIPDGLGPRATADLFLGLTALEEAGTNVEAVGYDLPCGCGVRIEVLPCH